MVEILNKSECTGCYACINSCPVQCIEIKEDAEKFEYVVVERTRCVNCNICEGICPSLKDENWNDTLL